MADPLSITASIVTLVGVADAIVKSFQKARNLRNAPCEVLALYNEVKDLRVVLDDATGCISEIDETSTAVTRRLRHMDHLVKKAKEQMLGLDEIIQRRILKSGSLDDEFQVSGKQWMRAKGPVEAIRQNLRDTRLNIMTQIMAINAYVYYHGVL